jgi:hypothetical protein
MLCFYFSLSSIYYGIFFWTSFCCPVDYYLECVLHFPSVWRGSFWLNCTRSKLNQHKNVRSIISIFKNLHFFYQLYQSGTLWSYIA